MSNRSRPQRLKILANVGLGVLAVATAAVVATAVLQPPRPAPASPQVEQYYSAMPKEPQLSGLVPVKRPASGPLKAVFAGDSLTYGLFASSEDKGYRPQVVSKLSGSGPVEATRGGQTGNTVKTVSDSITFPADTNLVILALGTNDVWKTDAADFAVQYKALVDKVKSSAPAAAVVCLGVWSNVDGARNYDPSIQQSCEGKGGKFLRINDLYEAAGNRGPAGRPAFGGISDDFHPNDDGYRAIAARILDYVKVS